MLGRSALNREIWFPHSQDEALGSLESTVEEQGSNQRLHHVADDIVTLARAVLACLLAEPDKRRDADFAPVLGTGRAVDQSIVPLGKISFGLVRIALVECVGDDHPKHAI